YAIRNTQFAFCPASDLHADAVKRRAACRNGRGNMLFPYADDPPPEGKFPWMNWLVIALNTAVFLAYGSQPDYDAIVMQYGFIPAAAQPREGLLFHFLSDRRHLCSRVLGDRLVRHDGSVLQPHDAEHGARNRHRPSGARRRIFCWRTDRDFLCRAGPDSNHRRG